MPPIHDINMHVRLFVYLQKLFCFLMGTLPSAEDKLGIYCSIYPKRAD